MTTTGGGHDSSSSYGATTAVNGSGSAANGGFKDGAVSVPRQTFSISEPSSLSSQLDGDTTPLKHPGGRPHRGLSCCRGESDGLRMVVLSMFVFAVGVTVALVVQIVTGVPPTSHSSDEAVSDHPACTSVAESVLSGGGNAVDAAVAATLCLAVVAPHVTGLGGGGQMLVHKHRSNKTVVIDFREVVPASARNDRYIQNPRQATTGRSSIAVPGFLRGLELAHARHGSGHVGLECCSWAQLVWPAIRVARSKQLAKVTQHMFNATQTRLDDRELQEEDAKYLREFLGPGADGQPLWPDTPLSDIPIFRRLLDNLELIARNGSSAFYEGQIADQIVRELDGTLTKDDLAAYQAVERDAVQTRLGKYQIIATPAPSAGPQLLAFLNAMEVIKQRYGLSAIDAEYLMNITTILERTAKLQLGLGDPANAEVENRTLWMLEKENAARFFSDISDLSEWSSSYPISEPAAAQAAIMDREDNYVSVVTSLNTWFGSKVMTSSGILLNNALSNLAIPTEDSHELKTANQMSYLRRPLTSSVAALAVDLERICGQRIIVGGATADSVGEVLSDALLFQQDLQTSIDNGRVQVLSSAGEDTAASASASVRIEDAYQGFDPAVLGAFQARERNNEVRLQRLPYTTVNGLDKTIDTVLACQDERSGTVLPL